MIQGVGTIRFQLDLGEILEIHEILFVPRIRVRKLSVSSFEDDGEIWSCFLVSDR